MVRFNLSNLKDNLKSRSWVNYFWVLMSLIIILVWSLARVAGRETLFIFQYFLWLYLINLGLFLALKNDVSKLANAVLALSLGLEIITLGYYALILIGPS